MLKFPDELEAAAEQLRTRSAELRAVKVAAFTAGVDLKTAKEKLEAANKELQATEGAVAVGQHGNTQAARKTFQAARDAVDFASARQVGVQVHLNAARQAEDDARKEAERHWLAHSAAVIADFKAMYYEAVLQFHSVIDMGLAISAALSGYPDADRLRKNLTAQQLLGIDNDAKKHFRDYRERTQIWMADPSAAEVHNELKAERERIFLGVPEKHNV